MNAHGGTTETSVTFSLAELMKIEQERLAEQEQQRQRRAELQQQAQREERLRSERQAQERLLAEEQQRREREQREREESARLEAMHHAVVEAERERAREQARALQRANEQEHERKLAALQKDALTRKLKAALFAVSIASSVFVLGGLTAFFGVVQPNTDRRIAQLTDQNSQRDQDNAQLRRKLETQSASVDKMLDQVRQGQVERSVLAARLDEAMKELERRGPRPGVQPSGGFKPPAAADTTFARDCTDPNDPMCNLNRR